MGENIRPVLDSLFYTEEPKRTIPSCPVDVVPFYHPYSSFHAYYPGSKDCKIKATQALPFFLDKFGPRWTEYTTTAHEQLPGHHLEVCSYEILLHTLVCFSRGTFPLSVPKIGTLFSVQSKAPKHFLSAYSRLA